MVIAICERCGGRFERGFSEHWKRLCLSCYKRRSAMVVSGDARRIQELERQVMELEGQLVASQVKIDEVRGMLHKLVMLCHPDKHGGSKLSNDVTQWLLKMRVYF